MSVQLDLFAEDKTAERAAWAARFTRAPWVAPHDSGSSGYRKGDVLSGWVCPGCGDVEINEFVLSINHGYDPSIPGHMVGGEFGRTCTRIGLRASQEQSRLAREAKQKEADQ